MPDEQHPVGSRDGIGRRDRHLELRRRVLGMQLEDLDRLGVEHLEQIAAVVGDLDQSVHPVPGTRGSRHELIPRAGIEHPLGLEAHARPQPALGGTVGHLPRERALTTRVRLAVLGAAVKRRPRPTGLSREHDEPLEIREQPQVADRPGRARAGGDRVVEHEHVEHRRHPDPVRDRVLESGHGHRLDPRDAAVVDVGGGDANDAVRRQAGRYARDLARLVSVAPGDHLADDLTAASVRRSGVLAPARAERAPGDLDRMGVQQDPREPARHRSPVVPQVVGAALHDDVSRS